MRSDQHASELSRSNLRACDGDRQHVIDALTGHTAVGRLTLDEFSARVDAVTRAKTYRELAAVTADLPTAGAAYASTSTTRPGLPHHPAGAMVATLAVILLVLLAGTVLATVTGGSGLHSMMAAMTAAMGCG
jgi:hypothetical protein